MTTIDHLLLKIINSSEPTIEEFLAKKDARVLRSLGSVIAGPNFITENQGNLLIKILRENSSKFPIFFDELKDALSLQLWSKIFRQIEIVKKMYISSTHDGTPQIIIEFTFSSTIRKKMQDLSGQVSGLISITNGKMYVADLTEKNIVELITVLEPLGFVIEEKLKNFHEIIKSWSESDVKNQFLLTAITHQNFQKQITADLGISTAIDENIIQDRSIRYQYFHENTEKNPENLVEIIANRKTPNIWIDKNTTSLSEVLNALMRLRRFPVLVVFDSHNENNSLEELKNLTESLENFGIYKNVGIYFRLNNDENGKQFNQYIAEKQLNCKLDNSTQVVGVQNGKIPKFLLKTSWKPMSVLSIDNQLRHSKTAVYANTCDLIISYKTMQPIIETKLSWS